MGFLPLPLGIARAIAEARALSDRLAGAPFLSSTARRPLLFSELAMVPEL